MIQFILIKNLQNPRYLSIGTIVEWDSMLRMFLTLDGQYAFMRQEVHLNKNWNMLKYYQFAKNGVLPKDDSFVIVVAIPISDFETIKPGNTVITDQGILKKVESGVKYKNYTHLKVIQLRNVEPKHYNAEKFVFITPERYGELVKPHLWTNS